MVTATASPPSIRSVTCLFRPDEELPGHGEWIFWCPDGDVEAALRAWVGPGLPSLEEREIEIAIPSEDEDEDELGWEVVSVPAVAMPLPIGLSLLSRVEGVARPRPGVVGPSDSIAAWSQAAKFGLELVAGGRFLPTLVESEDPEIWLATWAVVLAQDEDRERFRRLARSMPVSAHAWPGAEEEEDDEELEEDEEWEEEERGLRLCGAEEVLRDFLDTCADTLVRQGARRGEGIETPAEAPAWGARWLAALTGDDPSFAVQGVTERHLPDELWTWSRHALGAGAEPFRVLFDLNRPPDDGGEADPWRLEYELQSTEDLEQTVPMASVWTISDSTARLFQRTVRDPQDTVLRALGEAARTFAPIERSLGRPRPTHVNLRAGTAWQFLSGSAPLLRLIGHGVRLPPELDKGGTRRLHAQLEVSGSIYQDNGRGREIAWDAPAVFRCQIVLNDKILSGREFQSLVRSRGALRRWKGNWVCIDPTDLATLTRVVHSIPEGQGTVAEALTLALRGTAPIAPGVPEVPVVPTGELSDLVDALHQRGQPLEEPDGFRGELRQYQQVGLGWLAHMQQQGVGGILADEMGLGKTPMTLAFLLHHRHNNPEEWRPTLLVCPTSVLGNWQREVEKFVPGLPILRHHGPERASSLDELEENCPAGALVMTTYTIARLDADLLAEVEWAGAVLDEAQNIKNPQAAQTQALRRITAPRRLALTGTPVENRLADLWSILDWCNSGLLGPLGEFRRAVARPIERYRDPEAASRLRRLVEPFILRRLKSDPDVAPDLPDKVEATMACSLTRMQAQLYRKAVKNAWDDIQGKSGMQRRGRVLALLTALKQICNAPAHFKKESKLTASQSGKVTRLTEMLDEAVADGAYALVFTQFVEMGKLLVKHLQNEFGWEVPFLHGGLSAKARDAMVERFQEAPDAPPVFLLSLKAGGTGLNLTRATNVFHFDHWWNPAVESQATDRAHRIGQTETVNVYRLVSSGTLEEKIALMLDEKRDLANIAYGDGEQWLSDLGDDELRALVELSADAVLEDGDE